MPGRLGTNASQKAKEAKPKAARPKPKAEKTTKGGTGKKGPKKGQAQGASPGPLAKPGGGRGRRPTPKTLPGHRATKAEHQRHLKEAEHAHQDPRWAQEKPAAAFEKAHTDPRMDQGAIRTRGIPRMNPVVNWFRRAPKRGA